MVERASDLDAYKAVLAASETLEALARRCHSPATGRAVAAAATVIRALATLIWKSALESTAG